MRTPNVLLVEADRETRERIGDSLERAGMTVIACPGPTAPGYACPGACPLAAGADVVVLDSVLDGDVMQEGASAHELVSLYAAAGLPILVLARPGDWIAHDAEAQSIPWPAKETDVAAAVRRLVVQATGLRAESRRTFPCP